MFARYVCAHRLCSEPSEDARVAGVLGGTYTETYKRGAHMHAGTNAFLYEHMGECFNVCSMTFWAEASIGQHVSTYPTLAFADVRGAVSYTHLRAHETSAHL
eukprot:1350988-Alexandrium_andersonii.AAC.1